MIADLHGVGLTFGFSRGPAHNGTPIMMPRPAAAVQWTRSHGCRRGKSQQKATAGGCKPELCPAAMSSTECNGGHDVTESPAAKSHAATSSRQRNASSSQEARRFGGCLRIVSGCHEARRVSRQQRIGRRRCQRIRSQFGSEETQQQARGLENTQSNAARHHDPLATSSAAHPDATKRESAI